MKILKSEVCLAFLVLLAFGTGWYIYPHLPEQVAAHWNIYGEVDGYMSRFWGAFLLPLILSGLFIVLVVIPRLDPKSENIAKFRNYFGGFTIVLFLFLLYLYGLTLAVNLGYNLHFGASLAPAFSVLFYSIGIMLTHAEPNWTIGIRTPWTLSSALVWKKTHSLGGILFKASAVIGILGVFLPSLALWFTLVPIVCSSLISLFYSLLLYQRVK